MKKRFHRVKHHAGRAASGAKGTAMGAAAGGAAAYAVGQLAAHVEFIRSNWYAPALALMAAGHFLKRKHAAVGQSVIGAAGAIGYYSYALTHQTTVGTASGYQEASGADAGAWSNDVNALTNGSFVNQLNDARGADAGDYAYSEAMGLQT